MREVITIEDPLPEMAKYYEFEQADCNVVKMAQNENGAEIHRYCSATLRDATDHFTIVEKNIRQAVADQKLFISKLNFWLCEVCDTNVAVDIEELMGVLAEYADSAVLGALNRMLVKMFEKNFDLYKNHSSVVFSSIPILELYQTAADSGKLGFIIIKIYASLVDDEKSHRVFIKCLAGFHQQIDHFILITDVRDD